MTDRLDGLRRRARDARTELRALAVALADPRTPWYGKAVAGLTVGLAASPIDPIPDIVPVLGYVDDLVFVPVGIYLARRAIPEEVLTEARESGAGAARPSWLAAVAALLVVLGWAVAAAVAGRALLALA